MSNTCSLCKTCVANLGQLYAFTCSSSAAGQSELTQSHGTHNNRNEIMSPPPPPPPPPPSFCPAPLAQASGAGQGSKKAQAHPLVGGAEPELHGALMAELREFAKVRYSVILTMTKNNKDAFIKRRQRKGTLQV